MTSSAILGQRATPSPDGDANPTDRGRMSFRQDVQGMRGLAVLMVVLYHMGQRLPGGFIGVDFFFVVSGFVISRMLFAEIADKGDIDVAGFYVRRIRRILPALMILVALVSVASPLLASVGAIDDTRATAWASIGSAANLRLYYDPNGGYFDFTSLANPLLHMWSLAVEEQFYLVYPLLIAGIVRLRRAPGTSIRRVAAALTLTGLGSLVWNIAQVNMSGAGATSRAGAFYLPMSRIWEFIVGAGVAYATTRMTVGRTLSAGLSLTGGALLTYAALHFDDSTVFPGLAALFPVLGAAAWLVAGSTAGPLSRALSVRPLVWLGGVSYSWYLWHWPMIVFAVALLAEERAARPVAAALSLIPATLSKRLIEDRFRAVSAPRTALRNGLVFVGVGCLAVGGGAFVSNGLANSATWKSYGGLKAHEHDATPCEDSVAGEMATSCAWDLDPTNSVVLVGDSNAAHFAEALEEAGTATRMPVSIAASSACPFALIRIASQGQEDVACRRFVERTLASLIERRPALVFLSSAFDNYIEQSRYSISPAEGQPLTADKEKKAAFLSDGLGRVLDQLTASGIRTVVVAPVLKFANGWSASRCTGVEVMFFTAQCNTSAPIEKLSRLRAASMQALHDAVGTREGVTLLDVATDICGTTRCAALRDGVWWYRDDRHISVAAAERLAPRFAAAIESI